MKERSAGTGRLVTDGQEVARIAASAKRVAVLGIKTERQADQPAFYVPEDALAHWRTALEWGAAEQADWRERWDAYAAEYPEHAAEFERWMAGRLPDGWDKGLPVISPASGQVATRQAAGLALQAIAADHGASPSQLALAWLLKRSPVIVPIPGTSSVKHLEENTAAAGIELTDAEFEALATSFR